MAFTDINSEDLLVQKTFADHLRDVPNGGLVEWRNVDGAEGLLCDQLMR